MSEINNDVAKNVLKYQKQLLEKDKNVQRLKIIFNSTPVISSSKFFAARAMIDSTSYTNISKKINNNSILLVGAVLGALIGILYALIFAGSPIARKNWKIYYHKKIIKKI